MSRYIRLFSNLRQLETVFIQAISNYYKFTASVSAQGMVLWLSLFNKNFHK